ncbi:hypothetical protein BJ875DRAFT_463385 [Amylocarpus encephaloides]|uniref:Zn(2)-C6 fungal-type domain-containing protein n=1 Tax=Amylocarpus encephaloides TaxID=45428 RepID=A0A9P7YIK8_9HELO|nr:hypothetical protein BJ875DRAFT_463385 [Amylocarpus encephaloides]
MQSNFPGCSSFLIKSGSAPKGKRWSTPRSKTGCKTCKKRKFKCDEEKPFCKRCLASNLQCEGYEPTAVLAIRRRASPINKITIHRPPPNNLFDTDQEYRHFKIFHEETALQLTGCHDLDIWTNIVPQVSEIEPSIRHAVTAIGALNLRTSEQSKIEDVKTTSQRQAFAYRQYSKALVGVRKSIMKGGMNIRSTLLACILFATFESLHGNAISMTSQVGLGIKLIADHMSGSNPEPIDEVILEIFTVVEIEAGALKRSFGGLKIYLNPDYLSDVIGPEIPEQFATIREARVKIMLTVSRALSWMYAQEDSDEDRGDSQLYLPGPKYAQLCRILTELRRWNSAYTPIFEAAWCSPKPYVLKAAVMVRAHYLSYYLWLATAAPDSTTYYESYTKQLTEIVTLIRIIFADPTPAESFTLDTRVVIPLTVVGWRYKHRGLRREILDVIPRVPKRGGGVFHTVVIGKVIEWMIELEEGDLSCNLEYVPENIAVKLTKFDIDKANREVHVACLKPARDGGPILREKVIPWY